MKRTVLPFEVQHRHRLGGFDGTPMRGQRFLHLLILPAVRVHRFPQARGRVPEGIGESGPQTEPAKEVGSSLRYFLQTEWFGDVHAESSVFTAAAKAVTGRRPSRDRVSVCPIPDNWGPEPAAGLKRIVNGCNVE